MERVSKSLVLTPASCVSILRKSPYGRKNATSRRLNVIASNVRCPEEYIKLRARQEPSTGCRARGFIVSIQVIL